MTKVSIFSNGHRDEYKGYRDVKAGWMLIHPSGRVESGHSMDRKTAEKTARAHGQRHKTLGQREITSIYFMKRAIAEGFRNTREWNADIKRRNAEYLAQCKVEVVDL